MAKKDVNNDKDKVKSSFGKDLKSEMKKVTWPTFKELVNSTGAVISIMLIIAVIVFVLDVCFENINQHGVEKLKTVVSNSTSDEENSDESSDDVIEVVDETEQDNSSEIDASDAEIDLTTETTETSEDTESSNSSEEDVDQE